MNADDEEVPNVAEEMVDIGIHEENALEMEKEKEKEKEKEMEVEPMEEKAEPMEEKEMKKEVDLKDLCFGFLTEKKEPAEKSESPLDSKSPLNKSEEEIDDIKIEESQKQSWLYNFCSCSLNVYCCIR